MKIQNTNNVNEQKIKAVVYGLSGAGKTTLAKTLKEYRPLVISAESGLMSLAGSGIDFVDITKDDEGKLLPKEDRIKRLMQVYNYAMTDEARAKYNLLFIDSLTEISQCLFDAMRKEYPDRRENLVMFGEIGQKSRDVLKAFRDAGHYHVVFTCLSITDKDETGKRFASFDMIGSISSKLAQYFDFVLYLRVNQEGVRELICNSTDSIVAKNRGGKLLNVEPADLGSIFKKALQ